MFFVRLLATVLLLFNVNSVVAQSSNTSSPVHWDKYSLSINGERLFVFAGEFHYIRLPVPELWLDVFQKLKANGFNAITGTPRPLLAVPLCDHSNQENSVFLLEPP